MPPALAIPDLASSHQALQAFGVPFTDNVLPVLHAPLSKSSFANRLNARSMAKHGVGPLLNDMDGSSYLINVTLGTGGTYPVVFDTGSNNLWLTHADYQCLDKHKLPTNQTVCNFASTGPKGWSGAPVPDMHINVTYGDGSYAVGHSGHEKVTLAGVTSSNTIVSLMEKTMFRGDGLYSGIIGFSFPTNSGTFSGYDYNPLDGQDAAHQNVHQNAWIHDVIQQGKLNRPIFTTGFRRRGLSDADYSEGGWLALGGVPKPDDCHMPFTGKWANVPMMTETYPWRNIYNAYRHFNVDVEGFTVNGVFQKWNARPLAPIDYKGDIKQVTITDSGSTLIYATNETVDAIVAGFQPPATLDGRYYVAPCNATIPAVSFRIGGTDFPISKRDVLFDGELGSDPDTGMCFLGIQRVSPKSPSSHYERTYSFGAAFLRNVVAVHDLGNRRMILGGLDWDRES